MQLFGLVIRSFLLDSFDYEISIAWNGMVGSIRLPQGQRASVRGNGRVVPSTKMKIRRISLAPSQAAEVDLKAGGVSQLVSDPNGYVIYKWLGSGVLSGSPESGSAAFRSLGRSSCQGWGKDSIPLSFHPSTL